MGVGATTGDVVALLVACAPLHACAVGAGCPGCHIRFNTQDGVDAFVFSFPIEIVGTEKVPVIGDRHRIHAQALGFIEKVSDTGRTVQHRVLGVGVQVNKTIVKTSSHMTMLAIAAGGTRNTVGSGGLLFAQ